MVYLKWALIWIHLLNLILKNQMIDAKQMEDIQKYDHYRFGIHIALHYLSFKNVLKK